MTTDRNTLIEKIISKLKPWDISINRFSTSTNIVLMGFNVGQIDISKPVYDVIVEFCSDHISIYLSNRTANQDDFEYRLSTDPSEPELDKLVDLCKNIFDISLFDPNTRTFVPPPFQPEELDKMFEVIVNHWRKTKHCQDTTPHNTTDCPYYHTTADCRIFWPALPHSFPWSPELFVQQQEYYENKKKWHF
jgi:hypothetical protein